MDLTEHPFPCPYCGAVISVLLDPSAPVQRYVEDCEVCCNPIELDVRFEEEALVAFEARSIEQ
jgi:hypothetical protein